LYGLIATTSKTRTVLKHFFSELSETSCDKTFKQ